MLYPEQKERENRFKLALRMGLPVFALAVITVTSVLMRYFNHIPTSFVIVAFSLLGIMVYYLFYLIYQGFNERITDPITHVFTRQYFLDTMASQIEKKPYTFILISVENLDDINRRYGYNNGDRVLYEVATRLAEYFEEKKLHHVPIAHFKGGDFIIALEGEMQKYLTLLDLLCLKFKQYSIDEIEVELFGSIVDSTKFENVDQIVERLFELQNEKRSTQHERDEEVDAGTIEHLVLTAVEERSFSYRYQAVYDGKGEIAMYEMAVKLLTKEGRLIHQKRFMPVVHRLGLLRRYDEIQVEAAVEAARRLENGRKVAIDVSASTLRNPRFFDHVVMLVSNDGALHEKLVFVFSETNYYHQSAQFNARLQAFRRAGICIALDRLGGLHASLRYLQDLDIDIVRFEGYFGKEIESPKVHAIVRGLHDTVRALGIRSWIKMVESESQYRAVKTLGIDLVQGKYLSPIGELKE
jgi:EAL domain-containing protein (putative c-di-GMP-specific phosphodiesterase class I)